MYHCNSEKKHKKLMLQLPEYLKLSLPVAVTVTEPGFWKWGFQIKRRLKRWFFHPLSISSPFLIPPLRSRPHKFRRGLGSGVSSPVGSRTEPHQKSNLVHFKLKIWHPVSPILLISWELMTSSSPPSLTIAAQIWTNYKHFQKSGKVPKNALETMEGM